MTKEKILNFHQKNQMHERKTGHNSTYPKGGVSCSKDKFVVAESSVLRTNFCAEKPAHRQSAKRWQKYYPNNALKK